MVENEFDVWYSTLNSKQKKILERFSFGLIAVGEKRGRVEGAIAELRFQLKELNSWKGYKIDFEDGVQNIEKTNFFNQIKNNLKKRLKELKKGGKE